MLLTDNRTQTNPQTPDLKPFEKGTNESVINYTTASLYQEFGTNIATVFEEIKSEFNPLSLMSKRVSNPDLTSREKIESVRALLEKLFLLCNPLFLKITNSTMEIAEEKEKIQLLRKLSKERIKAVSFTDSSNSNLPKLQQKVIALCESCLLKSKYFAPRETDDRQTTIQQNPEKTIKELKKEIKNLINSINELYKIAGASQFTISKSSKPEFVEKLLGKQSKQISLISKASEETRKFWSENPELQKKITKHLKKSWFLDFGPFQTETSKENKAIFKNVFSLRSKNTLELIIELINEKFNDRNGSIVLDFLERIQNAIHRKNEYNEYTSLLELIINYIDTIEAAKPYADIQHKDYNRLKTEIERLENDDDFNRENITKETQALLIQKFFKSNDEAFRILNENKDEGLKLFEKIRNSKNRIASDCRLKLIKALKGEVENIQGLFKLYENETDICNLVENYKDQKELEPFTNYEQNKNQENLQLLYEEYRRQLVYLAFALKNPTSSYRKQFESPITQIQNIIKDTFPDISENVNQEILSSIADYIHTDFLESKLEEKVERLGAERVKNWKNANGEHYKYYYDSLKTQHLNRMGVKTISDIKAGWERGLFGAYLYFLDKKGNTLLEPFKAPDSEETEQEKNIRINRYLDKLEKFASSEIFGDEKEEGNTILKNLRNFAYNALGQANGKEAVTIDEAFLSEHSILDIHFEIFEALNPFVEKLRKKEPINDPQIEGLFAVLTTELAKTNPEVMERFDIRTIALCVQTLYSCLQQEFTTGSLTALMATVKFLFNKDRIFSLNKPDNEMLQININLAEELKYTWLKRNGLGNQIKKEDKIEHEILALFNQQLTIKLPHLEDLLTGKETLSTFFFYHKMENLTPEKELELREYLREIALALKILKFPPNSLLKDSQSNRPLQKSPSTTTTSSGEYNTEMLKSPSTESVNVTSTEYDKKEE